MMVDGMASLRSGNPLRPMPIWRTWPSRRPGPGSRTLAELHRGQAALVERTVAEEFEQRLVDATAVLPVGDPLDPATRVGRWPEPAFMTPWSGRSSPTTCRCSSKRSGYGRELATAGIHEFTNIRTFWVQAAGTPPPATLTE
jgi:hypothetical protein